MTTEDGRREARFGGEDHSDEVVLELDEFVDGDGTKTLLVVGAGNDFDWGRAELSLTAAEAMRDWLTEALHYGERGGE